MRGLSAETQKALLLSVGSHRTQRPLSPIEVGQALSDSAKAGSSFKELAGTLHLDGTSMVTRFTRLLALSPQIQHLVGWGQSKSTVGFTVASELARLKQEPDQIRACHAALEYQLSSSEVKQIVQLRLRNEKAIEDCIAQVLEQRPKIKKVYLFIGAVASSELVSALKQLRQSQRDELLRRVLQERYPELRAFESRLGTERFTIAGDEAVANVLNSDRENFEIAVNTELARKMELQ